MRPRLAEVVAETLLAALGAFAMLVRRVLATGTLAL
jgi:hypothetical protein